MEIGTSLQPLSCQAAKVLQTDFQMYMSKRVINPLLSNSGINSPGETKVPSDFCHLASASMLTSSPVAMLHLG